MSDYRWRQLQRQLAYDPSLIFAFLNLSATYGIFSEDYLTYLAIIKEPLGLDRIGKVSGKIENVGRSWESLLQHNRHGSYQRLILTYLNGIEMFRQHSYFEYLDTVLTTAEELCRKLLEFGPTQPPSEDELSVMLEDCLNIRDTALDDSKTAIKEQQAIQRKLDPSLPKAGDYRRDPKARWIARHVCAVIENLFCDISHFIRGFMKRTSGQHLFCETCGITYDWAFLLGHYPLNSPLNRYAEVITPGYPHLTPMKASHLTTLVKKWNRKAHRLHGMLLKKLLRQTEHQLWDQYAPEFVPYQLWN